MEEISPVLFVKHYQNETKIKIIDLRESREYELYHIEDTVNIPYSILLEKHHLFLNKHSKYYLICKNGNHSYQATKYLSRLGYNVINVIGGIDHFKGVVKTKYS